MAVELPKYKKGKREAWPDQESRETLSLCSDPLPKLCIYLALGCSMRIGEILGLIWDCFYMENKLIAGDEAHLYVEKELRRCDKKYVANLKAQGRDDIFFTFPARKQSESTTVLVLKIPESSVRNIYIPGAVVFALQDAKARQEALRADLGPEYLDFGGGRARERTALRRASDRPKD